MCNELFIKYFKDFIYYFLGTLLTTTILLHCIDAKRYHKESIDNLNKLKNIDNLRQGYYDDLISKWNVESLLMEIYDDEHSICHSELKVDFDNKLTTIPHIQYFSHCDVVDLSNQSLTSRMLPSLIMLQHCKVNIFIISTGILTQHKI